MFIPPLEWPLTVLGALRAKLRAIHFHAAGCEPNIAEGKKELVPSYAGLHNWSGAEEGCLPSFEGTLEDTDQLGQWIRSSMADCKLLCRVSQRDFAII